MSPCLILVFFCYKALSSFPLGNSGEEVLLRAHPTPRHLWNTRWRPVELNRWMWQSAERLQHHFQSGNQTLGPTKNRLFPWFPNDRSTCAWIYDNTISVSLGRWKTKNGREPPLKLKFEGLFGLLLKSDSIKESVIAQRDLESKEKRIFFSCQSMVHKKNKPTNFSKWYCRTLGTSSYWFQWHLLTLSRIFQLESSKLTVLRGRMLLQNHWCSLNVSRRVGPFTRQSLECLQACSWGLISMQASLSGFLQWGGIKEES